ncbi:hypothetical protein D3C72_1653540 [compost metagenome]
MRLVLGQHVGHGDGQRFSIEAAIGRAGLRRDGAHQKADAAFADIEQVTALEHLAADLDTVDPGAVAAAQVFYHHDANFLFIGECHMLPTDSHVSEDDVVGGPAAQGGSGLFEHIVLNHHPI